MQNFVEKGFQVIIVFYWGGDRVQIQLGPLNQQIANLPTYSQRLNQVMFFFPSRWVYLQSVSLLLSTEN